MKEFTKLQEESRKFGEKNDCTVKAFAIVTGMTYEDSRREMARVGRRTRKALATNNALFNHNMIRALKLNGFDVKQVQCKSKTVKTLQRNIKSNGRFLVFVRGHVLAIKNKQVEDWTKSRCHRIKSVWRVTN